MYNSRPLIHNSNQYFMEQKFISIHSEDRDITKFPNSAEFEITLPQEYLNVVSASLYSWSFPANYNVFSISQHNVTMAFKFTKLYNPGEHMTADIVLEAIFAALYYYGDIDIVFNIEPGFYNPEQMSAELTNKMNSVVSDIINVFLDTPDKWNGVDYTVAKELFNVYDRFKVVYNSVSQKLWFGNTADNFVLTNESNVVPNKFIIDTSCRRRNVLPEWSNWGLPVYLGFTRCNAYATSVEEFLALFPDDGPLYTSIFERLSNVPRFYYGHAEPGSGDNGYWLLPTLPGATVYFLQAPTKIAFMGPSYIYMEIEGMNCIDETSPYNLSLYTSTHSNNNGVVNSAFAKIPIPTTPISQWFDSNAKPYKYWNPPAERISKLKIKFRYHNNALVEFGQFEYSFMLEFNLLKPQQERSYSIVNAYDLAQHQSIASKYV